MCMFCLHVSLFYACLVPVEARRMPGPRELELDMVVNHHVGTLTGGWDMAQW